MLAQVQRRPHPLVSVGRDAPAACARDLGKESVRMQPPEATITVSMRNTSPALSQQEGCEALLWPVVAVTAAAAGPADGQQITGNPTVTTAPATAAVGASAVSPRVAHARCEQQLHQHCPREATPSTCAGRQGADALTSLGPAPTRRLHPATCRVLPPAPTRCTAVRRCCMPLLGVLTLSIG